MTSLSCADIGVVVLNYRGWRDTLACLDSLLGLDEKPRLIVVCDNGSGDGSADRLAAWLCEWISAAEDGAEAPAWLDISGEWPLPPLPVGSIILVRLKENGGFSAGNNAGLRLLLQDRGCRAFWLLNNDTQAEPRALRALVTRANEAPDAGMVGSTMVWFEPSRMVQCAGGGRFNPWLGTTRLLAEGLPRDEVAAMSVESLEPFLDFVLGASLLVRREVLERIGLLEDSYFLYYEDVEWCLRARKAGFRCVWARESVVLHREGGSSGATSAGRQARHPVRGRMVDYLSLRNRFNTLRRHSPAAIPLALASLSGILFNRLRRGQADRFGLVLRAAWDGLHGNMGNHLNM